MSEEFLVVGEWILVRDEKPKEQTESGIFIPSPEQHAQTMKAKRSVILGIGEKVEDPKFKVGDTIAVFQQAGLLCEDFGSLIKEGNILGIIKEVQNGDILDRSEGVSSEAK